MSDPKTVVITGGTRGIGYGLAQSFLEGGCQVAICGRAQASVGAALEKLASPEHVDGWACDVTDFPSLQALWEQAKARFGRVDIWINNAGLAHPQTNIWEFTPQVISSVIETNLTGAYYGTLVAVQGMQAQGGGWLYNMEGYGSNGRGRMKGMSVYGSTKDP